MDEKISQEIQSIITQCLPSNAKILFLSLTGSRAFGWASDTQDYDVHGVFFSDGYWDWVHNGKQGYDINLYEFSHIASDIRNQHFEQFMNWSNPFYIDPKFDHSRLMQFCTTDAVKQKQADIDAQINRLKFDKSPRTALHTYRILMVPLSFLENQKFQLDLFKINEKYGFQQLSKLKDAYNGRNYTFDIAQVTQDIDYLLNEFKQKLPICTDKPNMTQANQWLNEVKTLYAGGN
jgi:hypothetical protein